MPSRCSTRGRSPLWGASCDDDQRVRGIISGIHVRASSPRNPWRYPKTRQLIDNGVLPMTNRTRAFTSRASSSLILRTLPRRSQRRTASRPPRAGRYPSASRIARQAAGPRNSVVVEDIVNYHRHRIPLPKAGTERRCSTCAGTFRCRLTRGSRCCRSVTRQPRLHDAKNMRPLNLALVIDRSGSMAVERQDGTGQAGIVQDSCRSCVRTDTVSLVGYSNGADRAGAGATGRQPARNCSTRSGAWNLAAAPTCTLD